MKMMSLLVALVLSSTTALAIGGGKKPGGRDVPRTPTEYAESIKSSISVLGTTIDFKGFEAVSRIDSESFSSIKRLHEALGKPEAQTNLTKEKAFYAELMAHADASANFVAEAQGRIDAGTLQLGPKGTELLKAIKANIGMVTESVLGGSAMKSDVILKTASLLGGNRISIEVLKDETQSAVLIAEIEKIIGVDVVTFINNCKN